MTTSELSAILTAVARVEVQIENLTKVDSDAERRIDRMSARVDKLERIAYVALGIAVSMGLPDMIALIP